MADTRCFNCNEWFTMTPSSTGVCDKCMYPPGTRIFQRPPPVQSCDPEVFNTGFGVCALDASAGAAEEWVKKVAARSGQRVDWHYSGGRANVLYIGDYTRVLAAVTELEPELRGTLLAIFPSNSRGLYRRRDV